MEISEDLEVVIGKFLSRIRTAFAKVTEDTDYPGLVDQKNEPDSGEEHFSHKIKDVENALELYTPVFQEKILLAVLARLAEKKKEYELELQQNAACDDLLDVVGKWSVEKIEKLTSVLKDLVL
jgi:hypothetical protein